MKNDEVKRFGTHKNAFGFIRLLFASLVIVSHTPEMIDGNRSREILTQLFGTISFGELAVDGFFLVSGYLITGSYLKQPSTGAYLRKRVARIYPAFIAATVISFFVVAPLAGAWAGSGELAKGLLRMALLQPPQIDGVFAGTHHMALNGAMWSIAYEFRCYLLVLALGALGILNRVWFLAGLVVVAAVIQATGLGAYLAQLEKQLPYYEYTLGHISLLLRLIPIFLIGSIYYLLKDRIRFSMPAVLLASALLVASLFFAPIAELGFAIFGGYLIFALAQWGGNTVLARINNEDDISYGLYLYAWPVAGLLLWYLPSLGVFAVGALTWVGAAALGLISWHTLEKPVMRRIGNPEPKISIPAPAPASH